MIDAPGSEEPLYRVRVRSPIAPMHCEPAIASQMVSQQLAGHLVDVLDEEGEWLRIRGEDGYEGWVHRGFLGPADSSVGEPPRGTLRISLGCRTRSSAGAERALPLRALLLPDDHVVEGDWISGADRREHFPPEGGAIAESAARLFPGTSYLWGGVTPWGADCSGLVQATFALHGIALPRDAWQQAERGAEVSGGIAAAEPGDLLFFSDRGDRRVTHVGIACGSANMVHLSLGRGGYARDDMGSADPFVARLRDRFISARRLTAGA
jgi:hypothetical protein